jgi:hypothetical protein
MSRVVRTLAVGLAMAVLVPAAAPAQDKHQAGKQYQAEHKARVKRHRKAKTHAQRLHSKKVYAHEHRARVKRHRAVTKGHEK